MFVVSFDDQLFLSVKLSPKIVYQLYFLIIGVVLLVLSTYGFQQTVHTIKFYIDRVQHWEDQPYGDVDVVAGNCSGDQLQDLVVPEGAFCLCEASEWYTFAEGRCGKDTIGQHCTTSDMGEVRRDSHSTS